ncbi:MAG: hypothetical protein HC908_15110 [Calothrix sp. SM1_7_51]|nr:hypothetical protein [Calothrix sp. SM1_7_51]
MNLFAVGSGVGAASIVASGYEKIVDKERQPGSTFPILYERIGNSYLEILGESILFGIFVGLVVWIFFGLAPRRWQDWKNERKN